MENENVIAEVAEELAETETDEVVIDGFDELWEDGDVDPGDGGETGEPEEKTEEPGEETEEPEKAEEPAPEQKPEAENQRFKLKVNGAESEVDRDEVIALAQKGMDYDRIKAERDSFKADAPTMQRYKEQESFLKDLADKSGITVDALMENVRVRMAMDQDSSLTEDQARAKVKADAAARQQPAEEKVEEKAKEPSPEERRQAMFASFVQAYPDVKADSIPKEVWETAGRTFDLVGAYRDHEIRTLRKEVETLRQNNKNKERSTGSRRSVGNASADKAFDDLWYDDD